jgi:hypothetical protein
MNKPSGPRKTANLSESVHQQLNVYAIAAVVISLLVLTRPSEARIVYTPTNVAINGPYKLDLNHDGITDFTIQRFVNFAYPCSNGPWREEVLSEMPARRLLQARPVGQTSNQPHHSPCPLPNAPR